MNADFGYAVVLSSGPEEWFGNRGMGMKQISRKSEFSSVCPKFRENWRRAPLLGEHSEAFFKGSEFMRKISQWEKHGKDESPGGLKSGNGRLFREKRQVPTA
jgi:hypothetical protein